MNKRKDDEKILYIIGGIIIFIFLFLLAGNLTYYSFQTDHVLTYALSDMATFRFHLGLSKEYLKSYRIAVLAGVLIGMVFAVEYEKYYHDAHGIEAGSAAWNKDLNAYNKKYTDPIGKKQNDGKMNMILSLTIKLSLEDMLTFRNNNIIIIGAAGTGKTRYVVKPNLLQFNCSYVVTDPAGELLRTLKMVFEMEGYKIKVFNLVNMEYSNTYNPFHYILDDAGIGVLVETFITNTTPPEDSGGEPFWKNSEKAILTACIYFLRDFCDACDQNFAMILYMIQLAQIDEKANLKQVTPLDKLFDGQAIIKNGIYVEIQNREEMEKRRQKVHGSLAWKNYQTFRLGGDKTLKSILISAAVRLNPFNIPAIANLTSSDNIHLETIGDEKTILFVIIPQGDKTYNFLVSMMYSQLFECLYHKGEQSKNGRLKEHVRFIMDEFANVAKINSFPEKISTMRKYNISSTVILQSIAQIKAMYDDDFETVFGNCDTSILLGTQEQTTAEYFSKQLGKTTIRSRNSGLSKGKKSGSSMNFQQTGRELMTTDEIRSMSNNDCLVFVRGEKPFLDRKYDVKMHPKYQYTGDADEKYLYDITTSGDFLNVHFKESDQKITQITEAKEAEDIISQPMRLQDFLEKRGVKLDFTITDADKRKTVECLHKSKEIVDQALEKIKKENPEFKGMCTMFYGIDLKMLPLFVRRAFHKYQKPVLLLVKSIYQDMLEGYFIDKDQVISEILSFYPCEIAVSEEHNEDRAEEWLFHVSGLAIEAEGEVKLQINNGRLPRKSDDLLDEYYKEL